MQRGNANAGGGYIEQGPQQYLIRGIGLLRSPADIGNIVVAEHAGVPILVKDIGEVTTGAVPRQGLVGMDDRDDIVTGIVLMRKGENPSLVLDGVKEKVRELNERILPKNVTMVAYYDRTWLIETTLHTVFKNLAEGALLVLLVLYLFLGNFRSAAIVAVVIPLSLLATFLGLTIKGIPANLLSLGAMDFGIGRLGPVNRTPSCRRRRKDASPPGPDSRSTALPMTACSSAAQAASRAQSRRASSSTHSRTRSSRASTLRSPVTMGAMAASQAIASAASPSSQAPSFTPVSEACARCAAHRSSGPARSIPPAAPSRRRAGAGPRARCAPTLSPAARPVRAAAWPRPAGASPPPARRGTAVPGPIILFPGRGAQRIQHLGDHRGALRGQVPGRRPRARRMSSLAAHPGR